MTTETTTTKKPVVTLRDGSLKATIWKNTGEKGDYPSVRLTRTWTDEQGQFHDSDTFRGAELLRIARLANEAYDIGLNIRRQNRSDK